MSKPGDEQSPFSDQLIGRIAETISVTNSLKKRWLTYHLCDIASNVDSYRLRTVIRRWSDLRKAFAQTVKDCERLLKRLSTEPEGVTVEVANVRLQPFRRLLLWEVAASKDGVDANRALDDGTAEDIFDKHIGSISAIRDAAARARDDVATRMAKGRGGRRHQTDWALDEVLGQLIQLFEELTERPHGTSYSFKSKQAAGPVVRYLALCLPPLGWCLSPDAIRGHLRKLNGDRRS